MTPASLFPRYTWRRCFAFVGAATILDAVLDHLLHLRSFNIVANVVLNLLLIFVSARTVWKD